MINETEYEFKDISTEEYRIYMFPQFEGIRINSPTHLHVSDSGGHRILDASGESHYIPKGWIHLRWKAKEGAANFVA